MAEFTRKHYFAENSADFFRACLEYRLEFPRATNKLLLPVNADWLIQWQTDHALIYLN